LQKLPDNLYWVNEVLDECPEDKEDLPQEHHLVPEKWFN